MYGPQSVGERAQPRQAPSSSQAAAVSPGERAQPRPALRRSGAAAVTPGERAKARPDPGQAESAEVLPAVRRRERAVQRLAAEQRGLVTREQLVATGFSNGTIARWVESGRIRRLHRGVYVLGHCALAPWAAELAAVLAVGADAIVSHLSAAAVWGMRAEAPRPIDITVPARRVGHRSGIRVHRSARLGAEDVGRRHRLPVTAPERTLVDLAGVVGPRELEQALEDARIQRAISEARLRAAIARAGQTTGAATVRALLEAEREPALTRSQLERRACALVRTTGLPSPRVNARAAGYEADLYWPRHRLIVELDSYGFHSSRAAFERDRVKQTRLAAAGFTVLRLTWRRLMDEPQAAVADLAGALARVEAHGSS